MKLQRERELERAQHEDRIKQLQDCWTKDRTAQAEQIQQIQAEMKAQAELSMQSFRFLREQHQPTTQAPTTGTVHVEGEELRPDVTFPFPTMTQLPIEPFPAPQWRHIQQRPPSPPHTREPRMFQLALKPRDPPVFAGTDRDDVEVWITQVRTHLHLLGGSADQQVAYTATLFTGAAQLWWQRYLKQNGRPPATIDELALLLTRRFGNTSREQTAMASLLQMKQLDSESVHSYALRFEQALDQVSSFDEMWLQNIFIWGLHSHIATQVALAKPRNLDSAIQTALQVDQVMKMSRKPGTAIGGRGSNRGRGRGRAGAGVGQSSGAATSGQNTGGQHNTQRTIAGRQGPPTGPATSVPRCTYCGQTGHTQNRCWTKNPSLRPPNMVAGRRGGRGGNRGGRGGRGNRRVRRVGAVIVADPVTEGNDEQLVDPEVSAVFEPSGSEN